MSLAAKTTIAGYPVTGGRIAKRIGGARRDQHGGYVIAEVQLVHEHECRAWRFGRRHGPCTCGAQAAWQAFAERQGDADPFAGIRSEGGAGMTTNTTTLAPLAPRFEAVQLDRWWTVVDRLCRMAIVPALRWNEDIAEAVAEALNETPAYTAAFRWTALDQAPDGRAVAPLPGGGGAR